MIEKPAFWNELCNLLAKKGQVWMAVDGKVLKFPIRSVQRIWDTNKLEDSWRLIIDLSGYEITKKED